MDPTFSVIVPTHARPALLSRALASLLRQDFPDFECVVVDDGGPEAPALPDDARFRLVRHPRNLGLPSALNTGLDAATGEYVTFLDDDDELSPDRLSLVLPALGSADAVVCWARADQHPPIVNRSLSGAVGDSILDDLAPPKGALVLPRARVPRFDPRYLALEDLEWILRVAATAAFATVPRVGYLIHRHDGARATNGALARVRCGQMLLDERDDYFATHPRAAALRWRMIGVNAFEVGDTALARRAFLRSLRRDPRAGTLKRLIRSMAAPRTRVDAPDAELDLMAEDGP